MTDLTDAQRTMAEAMTEKELQQAVIALARCTGWETYHTFDSRRSDKGFPDLVMVQPPFVVFAELKTASGRLTNDQKRWGNMLAATANSSWQTAYAQIEEHPHHVQYYLWRPSDWLDGTIERILKGD